MNNQRTLKQMVTVVLTAALLVLILTTVVVFSASQDIINSHIHAVGGATLDYYRSQLDSTLQRIDGYCQSNVVFSLNAMDGSGDLMEQYRQKLRLNSTLTAMLSLSDDLYFTMAVKDIADPDSAVVGSRCSSMTHSDAIRNHLTAMAVNGAAETVSGQWFWLEIDGAWYLTRFYPLGDGFCAACVDSSILAMAAENEEDIYLFCRQSGDSIAGNDAVRQALLRQPDPQDSLLINGRSYALLTTGSIQGEFSIHCLVTSASSELGGYLLRLAMVLLVFCLAVPFILSVLLRYTTSAFSTLNQACVRVSHGDFSTEITRKGRFVEETQIYDAFNDMIEQIQDLRIDLYEQALYAQHSKLEFLRIQIKSHFFVNCLTVIHTLALAGNTATIEEFALCLADYFRYLGTGFSDTVSFGTELEHLHNFVKIHQIRYPGCITYHYETDPALDDFALLPMVPQTFVENIFKHAMGVTENIALSVRASGAEGGMWLEIRDNGPGFTPEQLTVLNDSGSNRLPGTGIANTLERLRLFYRGRSQVLFENDHGAVVRVFFPTVREKEVR